MVFREMWKDWLVNLLTGWSYTFICSLIKFEGVSGHDWTR